MNYTKNSMPVSTKYELKYATYYITIVNQWSPEIGHGSFRISLTVNNPTDKPIFIISTHLPVDATAMLRRWANQHHKRLERVHATIDMMKDEGQMELF